MVAPTIAIFILGTLQRAEISMRIVTYTETKVTVESILAAFRALRARRIPAAWSRSQCHSVGRWVVIPHHFNQILITRFFTVWYGQKGLRSRWSARIELLIIWCCWGRVFWWWAFGQVTCNECGAWANPFHVIPTHVKVGHSTCAPKLDCCNVISLSCFFLCALNDVMNVL